MKICRYLIDLIFLALTGQCPAATQFCPPRAKLRETQIAPDLMTGEVIPGQGIDACPPRSRIVGPPRISPSDHGWTRLSYLCLTSLATGCFRASAKKQ